GRISVVAGSYLPRRTASRLALNQSAAEKHMSDVSKKVEAQQREMPEPWEGNRPVPWLVIGVILGLFIWSMGYIWITHQDAPPSFGDRRAAADFSQPAADDDDGATVDAAKLYASNCV